MTINGRAGGVEVIILLLGVFERFIVEQFRNKH